MVAVLIKTLKCDIFVRTAIVVILIKTQKYDIFVRTAKLNTAGEHLSLFHRSKACLYSAFATFNSAFALNTWARALSLEKKVAEAN